MRFVKWLLALIVIAIAAGFVLVTTAPREVWPSGTQIGAVELEGSPEAWIAARETVFDDITEGTEKRITWAGEAGARTPLAVIYLHGFSATRQEISPVAERIAQGLGANLFETRFAGHGRPGDALATATAADWAFDLAEAMAIGRALGERVVLIGTSTGGSIATLAALDPAYAGDIAALIEISPNFEVNNPQAWLLDLPFARDWVPIVAGDIREWEPVNAQQMRYWTTRYPSIAVFPMRTVQTAAAAADHAAATVPLLVFYASGDTVVVPAATEAVIAAWGAPVEAHIVTGAEDPSQHVIAGDILSPGTTGFVVDTSLAWLARL